MFILIRSDFYRRASSAVVTPFVERVKLIACSRMTPQETVKTICIGIALGLLPLIWGTSLLCVWFAHSFRLNHLVLQSINYLLYPLQLALIVPFCKLGLLMLPWVPGLQPEQLLTMSLADLPRMPSLILWLHVKALAAWIVTVVPVTIIANRIIRLLIVK